MSKKKLGFTMIEVALFLAITGALFVGIAVGTQNSIFQQRYNDAVQNYAEFLRTMYAQTMNVQSEGSGKTEMAIYGKLVSFGETEDLAGNSIENTDAIYSYNVIGDVSLASGKILDVLETDANINVVRKNGGEYQPVGLVEDYRPRWASAIQNTNSTESFKGALLIVRHPASGTVYTFVYKGETLDINKGIRQANQGGVVDYNPLKTIKSNLKNEAVDFCVNPNGINEGGIRRDVRIIKGARNGSGVEIIGDEENRCERL
ncbi:MAG: hypothetical protein Q4A70_03765 [Candidatus Saccharibacteria bacterium]|nr:hypothetical protein [Candidatus Saccharibacteria bacterium]